MNTKKTSKTYWNKYRKNTFSISKKLSFFSRLSFYFFELNKIIKQSVKQNQTIVEIGCAPGNMLIDLAKKNHLIPYGIEYTKKGVAVTKELFVKNNFNPKNIHHADFFDKEYHKKNREKFDIVCSFGFIEHFENTKELISLHADLLKQGGTLIITVPNLRYGNGLLAEKKMLDKHNLKIMDPKKLKYYVPNNIKIEQIKYMGGPINFGLLQYSSKFIEILRKIAFLFQKIILEPVFYILRLCRLNLNNKLFSPSIILVGKKTK